ncbi:predicted protein [Uncinocarpus reesii 1704]|uniref:Calcineurin-like phosphoesterase domain-containing protein n=1 Tax=Uncinocarpus reesii (strain UAMH 1704) TaxID=336963 RepID=C4JNG8_UNCRE|nr:uncharacterized protein UREG_02966 [Uncinocarpus reesii 1704]EEP78121.1 predicted protein [Uncinocarpus reesii 1704]
MASGIKTRFFIISDTHGETLTPRISVKADVAIHCGDLTQESKISEFRTTIQLLKDLDAGLKLVIAGNHDFTLDTPVFKEKIVESCLQSEMHTVIKEYGEFEEARQLLDKAAETGIIFLEEGSHHFTLANGASLTVYASPWVPSASNWGFSFHPERGHNFFIDEGVDVVITHGPPKGILDYTEARQRADCSKLFEAVARARPRMHCFGHIHEGWGAKLVSWREEPSEVPSHFTDIDNERSVTLERLATLAAKKDGNRSNMVCSTSHCRGDESPLEKGQQTLFVNAAIQSLEGEQQLPWLVDVELPASASTTTSVES